MADVGSNTRETVYRRDSGCCRFFYDDGSFCASRQKLSLHHVRAKRNGGGNVIDNLVTVCRRHHAAIEQMPDLREKQHALWRAEGRVTTTDRETFVPKKYTKWNRRDMPTPANVFRRADGVSPRFAGAVLNKW